MDHTMARLSSVSTWSKYLARSGQRCGLLSCSGPKSLWRRVWARHHGIRFDGVFYCRPQCLETALQRELSRLQNQVPTPPSPNRMPLGLLMVARGKVTYDQVLAALAAQRTSGSGNIGEWFEKLGFLTEQEVAAALALQWGCPVSSSLESNGTCHQLPLALLETFQMWPLHYVSATNTQYMAFGKRLDHAVVYAIEKMLGCRVQPCVAPGKVIASRIERLRQEPHSREVEFRSMHDPAEIARIAISYMARLGAEEIRISRVHQFIWLSLKAHHTITNLLFRLQENGIRPPLRSADLRSIAVADTIPTNDSYLLQREACTDPRAVTPTPLYKVRLNSGTAKAKVSAAKIDR